MLVLGTAGWALSFPIMKAVTLAQQAMLPDASSWFAAALCMVYRFGIAAGVMLVLCWPTLARMTRSEVWEGVGLGAFASAGLILQMDGLAYTEASTSAFLTQCYCLIIPIWLGLIERRWPSATVLVSCALVVLGVGILSEIDWRTFRLGRGEAETVLASVVFAAQILWLQRPRFAGNNVNHFTLVMFAVISLCCFPIAWVTSSSPSDMVRAYGTPALGLFLGVLVLFSTLGGYLLMNAWQPKVSATEAGLIYCAEPLFASLAAVMLPAWLSCLARIDYPNEIVGGSLVAGGSLITLANVLMQMPAGRPSTVR
ncbi:MAG TPA: EamA family transporter [Verrucomicrobiota bacterium]|nr:EamA family transporter [Verrucomicrobiota bacterium]HRZ37417.1 EamA family transporter [Candidatus Paceibacterota bacterium]HRZ54170.1 EamA family transporter [Candidatus Paceibacterota bacterium]